MYVDADGDYPRYQPSLRALGCSCPDMSERIIGKRVNGETVWLSQTFPERIWGSKERAKRFPTERDASNFVNRLRRDGEVALEIAGVVH
jgi:hypothetical protein